MSEYTDVPAVVLPEERTVSEPESLHGERGTTRAGRPALAPAVLSEVWAQ